MDGANNFEKADFLLQYARETNWKFQNAIFIAFKDSGARVKGRLKSNLARIESEIGDKGLFKIYDLIRTTIVVTDPQEVIQSFEILKQISFLKIIKIQNSLNSPLSTIKINFIFRNKIIGEVILRRGPKPLLYKSNKLIKDLKSANTIDEFR